LIGLNLTNNAFWDHLINDIHGLIRTLGWIASQVILEAWGGDILDPIKDRNK